MVSTSDRILEKSSELFRIVDELRRGADISSAKFKADKIRAELLTFAPNSGSLASQFCRSLDNLPKQTDPMRRGVLLAELNRFVGRIESDAGNYINR